MQLLLMYRNLLQINVVGYDYTGYGLSTPGFSPSEDHCYADVEAVVCEIHDKYQIPYEEMVMFGKSLGSGPTVHIGSTLNVRGVIIESGFLSGLEVVIDTWSAYLLHHLNIFTNRYKMEYIRCPILVMHGKQDEIVDFSHAETLSALAQTPTYTYFVDGGHNDLLIRDFGGYMDSLNRYLYLIFQEKPVGTSIPSFSKANWCCV